jgi:hypothetical protein
LESIRSQVVGVRAALENEGPVGKLMSFCPGLASRRTGHPDEVTSDMRERGHALLEVMSDFASRGTSAAADD